MRRYLLNMFYYIKLLILFNAFIFFAKDPIRNTELGGFNKGYNQTIEIETEKIKENESDNILYFIGTVDGFIHAYKSNLEDLKWKIDLGNPLIQRNIDFKNISLVDTNILPGNDGSLYLTNLIDNSFEKMEVSVKSLIEKSPFTLPMVPNNIFLGDKISTMYVIDIEEGKIVSKLSTNRTSVPIFRHPIERSEYKRNQLLTIIRTDYVLQSFLQNTSHLLWNITVSEVIAIERGAKTEISYDDYYKYAYTNYTKTDKQEEIEKIKKGNDQIPPNSIVSIHKYKVNENLPLKMFTDNQIIFDNKFNYQEYLNSDSISEKKDKKQFSFKRYLNKTKYETKLMLHINSHFFNIYTFLILILAIICFIAIYFCLKTYKDNLELNKQIKQLKQKENRTENISAMSTNSKICKSIETSPIILNKTRKTENVINNKKLNNPIKIKNNFIGEYYPNYQIEKSQESQNNEGSVNNLYQDIEYKIEEINPLISQNSEEISLNSVNSFHISKQDKSHSSLTSPRSQISVSSQLSQKSHCKLEKVKNEEEFYNKTKLPFLNEAFHIGYKKTDMSSVTECVIEEDNQMIKKIEVRKVVTIYDKRKNFRTKSHSPTKANKIKKSYSNSESEENSNKNVSTKIQVNTKLTKNNFEICWNTVSNEPKKIESLQINKSNSNVNFAEYIPKISEPYQVYVNYPIIDNLMLNFSTDLVKNRRTYSNHLVEGKKISDKINKYCEEQKVRRKFSINEAYKNELLILQKSYLQHTNDKLGSSRINKSLLLKNDISISKKYSEILKIINDNSNSNESSEENFDSSKLYNHPDGENLSINTVNKDSFDSGRFIRNFEDIIMIGKGGFGCVFKARHKIDGSEYAIKIIKLKVNATDNLSDHKVVKEIRTMMKLHNKNIVRYITCWFELNENSLNNNTKNNKKRSKSINEREINPKKIKPTKCKDQKTISSNSIESQSKQSLYFDSEKYKNSLLIFNESKIQNEEIVSKPKDDTSVIKSNRKMRISNNFYYTVYFYMQIEYCKGFPLSYYLENYKNEREETLIIYMFRQILYALDHIHSHNIIHRDLKPANIFIHDYFYLKIGDFGLAADLDKCNPNDSCDLSENVGTPLYQSPEQIEGVQYNEKVDIYSLGIILLELCTVFKTQSERRAVIENVRNFGQIPNYILNKYPTEYHLIKLMTDKIPEKRPNTQDLISLVEEKTLIRNYDYIDTEEN